MTAESTPKDWDKELRALETEKDFEDMPRRRSKRMPTGQRPDIFATSLGAFLGGAVVGIAWFAGFWYDWFYTPWIAVGLALAIVYGVKFGATTTGAIQTGISLTAYVLILGIVVTLITYYQTDSLQVNFDAAKLENLVYKRHFAKADTLLPYAAGLFTTFALSFLLDRD